MDVLPHSYEDLKVLIAEDDECSYLLIQELLSAYKLQLIWAKDANEALHYINSGAQFCIAILDLKLPDTINRIELAAIIRNKHPATGIIIQSAAILTH